MWLSERREDRTDAGGCAFTGPVTVPGEPAAVWLAGERRGVQIYAPGGYHWVPRRGDQVLVLKAGQEGESPCALGMTGGGGDLKPGEVRIESGGASVTLRENGQLHLNGQVFVNGVPLEPTRQNGV